MATPTNVTPPVAPAAIDPFANNPFSQRNVPHDGQAYGPFGTDGVNLVANYTTPTLYGDKFCTLAQTQDFADYTASYQILKENAVHKAAQQAQEANKDLTGKVTALSGAFTLETAKEVQELAKTYLTQAQNCLGKSELFGTGTIASQGHIAAMEEIVVSITEDVTKLEEIIENGPEVKPSIISRAFGAVYGAVKSFVGLIFSPFTWIYSKLVSKAESTNEVETPTTEVPDTEVADA